MVAKGRGQRVSFSFRCSGAGWVLPVMAAISLLSGTVSAVGQEQSSAAVQNKGILTKAEHLRMDTAKLNELTAKLQLAVDKSNADQLSVEVIRLSQQVQGLSRQIQLELKNP